MPRIRLWPVVVVATATLLALIALGLAEQGRWLAAIAVGLAAERLVASVLRDLTRRGLAERLRAEAAREALMRATSMPLGRPKGRR